MQVMGTSRFTQLNPRTVGDRNSTVVTASPHTVKSSNEAPPRVYSSTP